MLVRMLEDTFVGDAYYKRGQIMEWPAEVPLPARASGVGGAIKDVPLAEPVEEPVAETAPAKKRKGAAEAKTDA